MQFKFKSDMLRFNFNEKYFLFLAEISLELLFTYHPAWILLCAAIAFGYSFFLYRKDALLEEVKKSLKWLMAAMRFVSVFIICLLLLGIVLENLIDKKEKPLIFVANDNSESIIANKDSAYYKNQFTTELQQVAEAFKDKFEVVEYNFSDEISAGLETDYKGKTTDIAKVINQIFDQYTNRNIGGIVLATDGIYNVGSNPIYALARKSFLPIFTVGLGDTTEVKDVKIEFTRHNDIAFLGNKFPVEIGIAQSKFEGETAKVSILKDGKLIAEKSAKFSEGAKQLSFLFDLTATTIGFQKYTVNVTEFKDEFSYKNNKANFYVEVIDGRQKILVAHNGPHPDISALKFVIENNKNYEVDVSRFDEVKSLKPYDLAIIHNYSSSNSILNDAIEKGATPTLFIVGNRTEVTALTRQKIGFTGTKTDIEEISFKHNAAFKEILLSPGVIQLLNSAPPLQSPFGTFGFSGANEVLAYQKIGNVTLDKPLIYFNKKNSSRYGVIMGEGIWRWRLYDQQKNSTTVNFEEFISKLITYLAVKDNKDPFKVSVQKEYNESENVVVKAELYNKSFELINEPEVVFKYSKDEDNAFEPHFVRMANAYELNLGKLEQGIYKWEASTDFQGSHYQKNGSFLVKEIKIEQLNTQANHRLLYNMAQNSNGKFYLPNELKSLQEDVLSREDMVTVVYQEKSFDDLIDYKILFFLIMLLLSLEWFFRKYSGAY